jgi:ABC-type oligopeptide transport system substrate-binding subunit
MKAGFWLLVFVSLVAVSGCGKGIFSQKASTGKSNVFRYPIVPNPTSLDPGMVQDGDTIDLVQQVYDGLVAWGENNEPVRIFLKSGTSRLTEGLIHST